MFKRVPFAGTIADSEYVADYSNSPTLASIFLHDVKKILSLFAKPKVLKSFHI